MIQDRLRRELFARRPRSQAAGLAALGETGRTGPARFLGSRARGRTRRIQGLGLEVSLGKLILTGDRTEVKTNHLVVLRRVERLLDGGFNLCHDCQSTCRNACDVAPDDCVIYPTLLPVLPFQFELKCCEGLI